MPHRHWRTRVLRTPDCDGLGWSRTVSSRDDDRFRVRPGSPKQRGDAFINKVLRQANKAGAKLGKAVGKAGQRPGSRLGRGHVPARFADRTLTANSRRVTIKARLVNLAKTGPRSTAAHLRYIEREGVDRQGGPGHAYGPTTDAADTAAFEEGGREDRHQFRFIVSPEDAEQLEDLRTYTRHLMARMEADLGTRLEWVAVDHWNTDNPHTHVVLRGKDDTGKDLIISRDYIAEGMRHRASELATEWLGPRTELETQRAMQREVEQERWTGLDRTLQREAVNGLVQPETLAEPRLQRQRQTLIGRLQRLQRMGLATEQQPGTWAIHANAEATLRAVGERGDIIRTMQRAMSGRQRELAVFQPGEDGRAIVGRVVGKGLADELYDKGYLAIDGIDGKAHYVALPPRSELEQYPNGAVVEVKGAADVRVADRNIAALTVNGVYRTDHHLAVARDQASPGRDPREVVAAHVRRLEALRRAGIVERAAEGVWHVPGDLAERGRQYDAQRLGDGVAVELKSNLPIERQTRVIGATWLDQQLISGGKGLGDFGFGRDVKDALHQRSDFLIEQGLAERRGQRVILARHLLATLRGRELAKTAQDIAAETGLEHRPVPDGQRVVGIYRRSVMLASRRYAMLDDGIGFSLVPWRAAIEQRLGQQLTATVRGSSVSWEFGRNRGPSIG
jgi:type IV secretory pathway VirD2 relaxase